MKRSFLNILTMLIMLVLVACGGSKLQKQLDLGQKYLEEADYANALIAFETAINIDANSVEAYIGAADAYIGLGQPDKAVEILDIGFNKTGNPILRDKYDYINREMLSTSSREDVPEELADSLDRIIEACHSGNPDEIFEFTGSEEYYSVVDSISKNIHGDSYRNGFIYDNGSYKIGIYYKSFGYGPMIYIGDYEGDQRSGNGIWFSAITVNKGEWKNDAPNGYQESTVVPGGTRIGNVIDGLWDGIVTEHMDYSPTYHYTYNLGMVKVLRTINTDSGIANCVIAEDEGSIVSTGEFEAAKTHGIEGFAESGY